jgi:hypothetical protein
MLHELLLIRCVEMLGECLGSHYFELRLARLRSVRYFKWLVLFLIHSLKVKSLRLVMVHSIVVLVIRSSYFNVDYVVPSLLTNSCCLLSSLILSSVKLFW